MSEEVWEIWTLLGRYESALEIWHKTKTDDAYRTMWVAKLSFEQSLKVLLKEAGYV